MVWWTENEKVDKVREYVVLSTDWDGYMSFTTGGLAKLFFY